jgi:hypothetical protein
MEICPLSLLWSSESKRSSDDLIPRPLNHIAGANKDLQDTVRNYSGDIFFIFELVAAAGFEPGSL